MKPALWALPVALFVAMPVVAQDGPPPPPEPQTVEVVLETTKGDIVLAIETERAPITAANFLRYVDEGRLDGTVFYRAMKLDWGEQPNGLIQAGTQNNPKLTLPPIAHEPSTVTGVKHIAGAISMARYAPGTASGDFSILLRELSSMDAKPDGKDEEERAGYAAFGHVVKGMDVVFAIHAAPIDPEKGSGWMKGQMLADPVRIVDARRVASKP
ncbi:MAG: peptidylprolyl isomerase [Novosphingobium sp.]|nr:peptidylprolyl isomerase [Novosphingobium sp.]